MALGAARRCSRDRGGLGPACGGTITITIAPDPSTATNGAAWVTLRISGNGSPPVTFGGPPNTPVETVVAGSRTIRVQMVVPGGSTVGGSGTFDEAGTVVAFISSGWSKADLLTLLAGLRPASSSEWAQAGSRS